MTMAAATKGNVLIKNIIPKHLEAISSKLNEIGARVIEYDDAVRVMADGRFKATQIKTLPYPGFPTDMQPQMAVTLALSQGTSVITESIFENRFKYVSELSRMGARIKVEGNSAVITGVDGYTGANLVAPDLRAGAALVIAALAAEGFSTIDDIKYILRGYEDFDGKIRGLGTAMAMQGSAISNCDVGSVTIKLSDEGFYNVIVGCTDMGTGCDTILAQMAADCLDTDMKNIVVFSVDTDISPYDSGSYASSTTYVTGKAVELACEELKKKLCAIAAGMLGCEPEETVFEDGCVRKINTDERVTLAQISVKDQVANDIAAVATASHSSPVSPPPYMVGMVEIELDRYTGEVKILDYVAVVDCGIAINPALARIQAEGGIVQGIGHTLFENITYDETGKPVESNFMQYKIPTRLDMGHLRVEFENSYEPTGPFGAKSIGEIVINTPAPAIAHAIYPAPIRIFLVRCMAQRTSDHTGEDIDVDARR